MKSTDRIVDGMNIGAALALAIWFYVSGCTAPQSIQFAPPVQITVQDSLNNNTVPMVKK